MRVRVPDGRAGGGNGSDGSDGCRGRDARGAGDARDARDGRDPGVDAVRALALLGSAVATALVWLHGSPQGAGYRPLGGSSADRAVDAVTAVLVDNRVLPVFALLLGWGLAVRLEHVGRAPLLRRGALLVGLGALHAALLLEADVLAALGVLVLVGAPLVTARLPVRLGACLLALPALLLHGVADGLGGSAGFPDPPTDYLLSAVDRWGNWLLGLVLLPFVQLGLLLPLLAGAALARAGWLRQPWAHRRGLLVLGLLGAGAGVLGALPYARVVAAGEGTDVTAALVAGVLSSATGPVAAVGVVCLAVLLVPAVAGRGRAPVVPGLALLGRRSLTVYLAHSLVLALALAPWAGGLGSRWGSAAVVALAVVLWLATLAAAGVATAVGAATGGGPAAAVRRSAQPSERQGRERSSAT